MPPHTVHPLSPLVRKIVCDNPGPFTGTGTNTYIVGSGRVVVIDPGPNDHHHLRAIVEAVRGETVVGIFITHTHLDHSPLAAALKRETGAQTYGFGPHGQGPFGSALSWRTLPSLCLTQDALGASGDMAFTPDHFLRDGDVFEDRGITLEAVFTPGHAANHLAFAFAQENALFCGDHVMTWSTPVIAPPDGKISDYLASLRKLLDRKEDVYWPGHGGGKTRAHSLVRSTLHQRNMREQAIFRAVTSGCRTLPTITSRAYPSLMPALQMGATLSTLAHLEHLCDQNLIDLLNPHSPSPEFVPKGKR